MFFLAFSFSDVFFKTLNVVAEIVTYLFTELCQGIIDIAGVRCFDE